MIFFSVRDFIGRLPYYSREELESLSLTWHPGQGWVFKDDAGKDHAVAHLEAKELLECIRQQIGVGL